MKPLRTTQVAERLIFILCWSIACFFAGKFVGEEHTEDRLKASCLSSKPQSLFMEKRVERNWINYWKLKGV